MSVMEIFGWVLAGIGAVCTVGWLIYEARTAPTEVEEVPLSDLLEQPSDDDLRWTDPIVLAGAESLEYAGHCCIDCGAPAEYLLAYAMSSTGAPIEAAFCKKHADHAMSNDAEEAQ
jgi:hypothetical protein